MREPSVPVALLGAADNEVAGAMGFSLPCPFPLDAVFMRSRTLMLPSTSNPAITLASGI